jgi:hypothetical protein
MTSRDKHWIDLKAAVELTTRWREKNPKAPKAMGFDRAAMDRILKQERCVGIRTYYALNPDDSWTLVMVGVDSKGRDMTEGELAEEMDPCPPDCDPRSVLGGGGK